MFCARAHFLHSANGKKRGLDFFAAVDHFSSSVWRSAYKANSVARTEQSFLIALKVSSPSSNNQQLDASGYGCKANAPLARAKRCCLAVECTAKSGPEDIKQVTLVERNNNGSKTVPMTWPTEIVIILVGKVLCCGVIYDTSSS